MTKARDLANAGTALTTVSATELGYLDGVTSAVQTQMDAKLASSTAATTYVANSLADAKGDLFVASADNTVTRLPVGSTGETIVADSSTSTGLAWAGNYAAGKNKIINGDFGINQRRANTFTTTNTFIADRFDSAITGDGTVTFSRQVFTPGTAPLASYEGTDYVQIVTTGQTTTGSQARLRQKIESVRQLANQPVTISFWAKAATGTPFIAAYISQFFGTGGSPSSAVDTAFGKKAISTSWARYSFTATLPSISGKTLGTDNNDVLNFGIIVSAGSDFNTAFSSIGIQSNTFSIWGLQVEAGSVASAFQTASGSIAGELALAQRYYQRIQATSTSTFVPFSMALGASTTQAKGIIESMVTLRNVPSTVDFGGTIVATDGVTNTTITTVTIDAAGSEKNLINFGVASGLTQFRPYVIRAQSDSTAFIGLSAEL